MTPKKGEEGMGVLCSCNLTAASLPYRGEANLGLSTYSTISVRVEIYCPWFLFHDSNPETGTL